MIKFENVEIVGFEPARGYNNFSRKEKAVLFKRKRPNKEKGILVGYDSNAANIL